MDDVLQLNEFFIEGNDPNKSHVLLNITEPSTPEEKQKGYFFAICEIDGGDNRYIMKLQDIIDEMENNYYELENKEDKSSLETVLNKVNEQSFLLIKDGIGLSCVIGVIQQTDIVFSFYGKPQVLLFYKNKQEQYKKIDLVEENANGDEEAQTVFGQIIQGKISTDDYFFVGTSRITDYFSQDRLQKIISSRPSRQSSQHLERVLKELKNGFSFGGMVIHLQKPTGFERFDKKTKTTTANSGSAKSLTGLFNTAKNTTAILSPSLLPSLKKITSGLSRKKEHGAPEELQSPTNKPRLSPLAEINSAHLKARPMASDPKHADGFNLMKLITNASNTGWRIMRQIAKFVADLTIVIFTLVSKLVSGILLFFLVVTNYKNKRKAILTDWSRAIKNSRQNIRQLPIYIKLLFILSLLALIALIGSIVYLRNKQKIQAEYGVFTQAMQSASAKKDSAESYMIYNDNAKALADIKTAKDILSKANCAPKERQSTCQNLLADLDNLLNKVRRLYTITVTKLDDWSVIDKDLQVKKLLLIDKKLVGYGPDSSKVFIYDLLKKTSQVTPSGLTINGFTTAATPKENDYAIFASGQELAQYDPKSVSWKKTEVTYPNKEVSIAGLFVYNRKLYTLDTKNSQIYKHDAVTAGFGTGKEWIAKGASVNLSKAIDLAIDGDVFVLTKDGNVKKFTSGIEQGFVIQDLDPKLDSCDLFWTYYELKYLYILDSSNKRLVILNKTDGTLKKQLTATELVKPTGMVIDENGDTGYILDGNILYSIELGLK